MPRDNLRTAVFRSLNKPTKDSTSLRFDTQVHTKVSQRSSCSWSNGVLEQEKTMAFEEDSESQLLQVSRGAQKLTEMIQKWSKVPGSNDVARDILQGALDLQESLLMLGKLQEASKMLNLEETAEKTSSRRFDKYLITYRPSTHPEETRKTKKSNLIAKLMGLEEVHMEATKLVDVEDKKKYPIRSKNAIFDIEMPKSSMLLHQTTFDEIIQSMQLKGQLKSGNGYTDSSKFNGNPPIVIMKPLSMKQSVHVANKKNTTAPLILRDRASNHSRTKMQKFERKTENRTSNSTSRLPQTKEILKNNFSKHRKEPKTRNQKRISKENSKNPSEDNKAGAKSVSKTTISKSNDKRCKRIPKHQDYQPCMMDEDISIPSSVRASSKLSERMISHDHDEQISTGEKNGINKQIRKLLLSSKVFLNRSRVFLGTASPLSSYDQPTEISKLGMRNSKLFLDYANELLMCKYYELMHASWKCVPKLYKSLDQLVEEISNEIQEQYETMVYDSECRLRKTSRRYLKCKNRENWETWMVKGEMEKLVVFLADNYFSNLIQELVIDLTKMY